MYIGALSMVMIQSRTQESAGIAVMKVAMDTGKEATTQVTEMIKNMAVDPKLGQNLASSGRTSPSRVTVESGNFVPTRVTVTIYKIDTTDEIIKWSLCQGQFKKTD